MDISVVIVNYNVKIFLRLTLQALFASKGDFAMEVFVVDNASMDGSVEMVRQEFPQVICIANDRNWGFSYACNQAIRKSRGRYVLLLNPDNVVEVDTIATMIQLMDTQTNIGAAGCRMNAPDGSFIWTSRRGFPDIIASISKLTSLQKLFPNHPRLGKYNLTYLPPNQSGDVEALSGAFFMVRRETFEQVGLLDDTYFMYGEDIDWSYRIYQAGWRIYYESQAVCTHYYRRSSRKRPIQTNFAFHQAMAIYYRKFMAGKNVILDVGVYLTILLRMFILLAWVMIK